MHQSCRAISLVSFFLLVFFLLPPTAQAREANLSNSEPFSSHSSTQKNTCFFHSASREGEERFSLNGRPMLAEKKHDHFTRSASSLSIEDSVFVGVLYRHNIPVEGSRSRSWGLYSCGIDGYSGSPAIVSGKVSGPGFDPAGEKLVFYEYPDSGYTWWEPSFYPTFESLDALRQLAGGDMASWTFTIELADETTQTIIKNVNLNGMNETVFENLLNSVSMRRQGKPKELVQGVENHAFEPLQVLNPLSGGSNVFEIAWDNSIIGAPSLARLRGRLWSDIYRGVSGIHHRVSRNFYPSIDFDQNATFYALDLDSLNDSSSAEKNDPNWKHWFLRNGLISVNFKYPDRPVYAQLSLELYPDVCSLSPRLRFYKKIWKNRSNLEQIDYGANYNVYGGVIDNGIPEAKVVHISGSVGGQELFSSSPPYNPSGINRNYTYFDFELRRNCDDLIASGGQGIQNMEVTVTYQNGEQRTMSWPFDSTYDPNCFGDTSVYTITEGGVKEPLSPYFNAETLGHLCFEENSPPPVNPASRSYVTDEIRDLCYTYYYNTWQATHLRDVDDASAKVYPSQIWQTEDETLRKAQQEKWYSGQIVQNYDYVGNVGYRTRHYVQSQKKYLNYAILEQYVDYRPDKSVPYRMFSYDGYILDSRVKHLDAEILTQGLFFSYKSTQSYSDGMTCSAVISPSPQSGQSVSIKALAYDNNGAPLMLENGDVVFQIDNLDEMEISWAYSVSGKNGPWVNIVPGNWNVPSNTTHIRLIHGNLPDSTWRQQGTMGPNYKTKEDPTHWQYMMESLAIQNDSENKRVISVVDVTQFPSSWIEMEFSVGVRKEWDGTPLTCTQNYQCRVAARFTREGNAPQGAWVIGTNGNTYKYEDGSWTWTPAKANYLAAVDDDTCWISQVGSETLYKYDNGTWTWTPAKSKWITAYGSDSLWLVQATSGILYRYESGSWIWTPAKAKNISAPSSDVLWLIQQSSENLYRYTISSNTWEWTPGKAKSISAATEDIVWIVGLNDTLYKYDHSLNKWIWHPVEARAVSAISATEVLFVNLSGKLCRFKDGTVSVIGGSCADVAAYPIPASGESAQSENSHHLSSSDESTATPEGGCNLGFVPLAALLFLLLPLSILRK